MYHHPNSNPSKDFHIWIILFRSIWFCTNFCYVLFAIWTFHVYCQQTGFFTRLLPFSYLLEVKHHLIQTTFLSNLATCSDSELPARNPLPSPPPPLQPPPPISFTGHRNLLPPPYPLQPLWIRSFGPIYLTTSSTTSSLSSLSKPSSLSDQHPSISGLWSSLQLSSPTIPSPSLLSSSSLTLRLFNLSLSSTLTSYPGARYHSLAPSR